MTPSDPPIPLDAETTAALDAPAAPACPGPPVQEVLQAAANDPADVRGGFFADDGGAPASPAAEAGANDASLEPEPVPSSPIVAAPDGPVRESPARVAPGEAAVSPDSPPDPSQAGGAVNVHVVNYYARGGASLSDLPNEWAGNRGRS